MPTRSNPPTLAQVARAILDAPEATKKELAAILGVGTATVSRYRAELRNPDSDLSHVMRAVKQSTKKKGGAK